jgi:chloramphenicol 3-O phosphotransferase
MRSPEPGLVVLLNGASSSGKSTIARALLPILEPRFFHMPVDAFHMMRVDRDIPPEELEDEIRRTCLGFHRAVAGMAAAGNHVVMDHVLSHPWRLRDCLELFCAPRVLFVGVQASREDLRRRERARGDREPGLAERQLAAVHAHGLYDLECDTSTTSAPECARRIGELVRRRPAPTAFEQLEARRAAP